MSFPADRKRGRDDEDELTQETRKAARFVAEHYSARSNQSREERESSPIIHLKKLNNWIKSVLIKLYVQRGSNVLDLACGKGGDLIKYDKAFVGHYVGVDIASGSIEDARTRYNNRRQRLSFPARLICADCYEVSLDKVLKDDAPFDTCSCQFALHYSWSTEERARKALSNVSTLLSPGGHFIGTMPDSNVIVRKLREAEGLHFGNNVFNVKFDDSFIEKQFPASKPFGLQYHFKLEDAVDCPEWLVPFSRLKSLAEEYDLELIKRQNFHEFVHEYVQQPTFEELMRKLGPLGNGTNEDGISEDEWDAAYLYLVFVFRKTGKTPINQKMRRGSWKIMKEEDILHLN